jgi:phosphate acetyltransferase
MNKAIYIATLSNSGKSIITLGLMSMLIGKTAKVGYFRPIIEDFEDGKLIIILKRNFSFWIRHCI